MNLNHCWSNAKTPSHSYKREKEREWTGDGVKALVRIVVWYFIDCASTSSEIKTSK